MICKQGGRKKDKKERTGEIVCNRYNAQKGGKQLSVMHTTTQRYGVTGSRGIVDQAIECVTYCVLISKVEVFGQSLVSRSHLVLMMSNSQKKKLLAPP